MARSLVRNNLKKQGVLEMSNGKKFSQEQFEKAYKADLLTYVQKNWQVSKKPNEKEYRLIEHDSLTINVEKNMWYWWSKGIGGTVIDFARNVNGLDYVDAVLDIINEDGMSETQYKEIFLDHEKTKKTLDVSEGTSFTLSERNDSHKRVFAYLNSTRRISQGAITWCMKNHILYEDKEHHNCIFVGRDKNGVERYGCVNGTSSYKRFKQEVQGSQKEYGFNINLENAKKVFVTESPIDLLSYITLKKINLYEPSDLGWIALGGLSDKALDRALKDYPNIKEVCFGLDNDEKGIEKGKELFQKYKGLGIKVSYQIPDRKDWNEVLKESNGVERGD